MSLLKKISCLLVAISMLFSLLITGCENKGSTASEESAKTDSAEAIKVGISAYPSWYVWFICKEEGIFEKYNLNVDLVWFANYSDSVQAFEGDKLDFVSLALADVLSPYAQGKQDKVILINDYSNGADGLVAKEGIKSIKDLKGKTVATEYGTIEHFLLVELLKRNGMTEEDINFQNMTISDSGAAFLTGSVDAASLWEPALSQALNKEGSTQLYSSKEDPGMIPSNLIVNDKFVEKYKDSGKIEDLLNAWFDGLDFYRENPDKAISDMAKGAGIGEEEMKQTMAGSYLYTLAENIDAMTIESDSYNYIPYTASVLTDFLLDHNFIESKPSEFDSLFDVSYLQNIADKRESTPAPDTSLK